MPERSFSAANQYRYGFNGKENDKDISEGGQDYGMRISDTRLGKFLSVDPITKSYPQLTPYQFASNSPISGRDLDGLEFVLSIYDPNVASKFNCAVNDFKDIYSARKIAYEAIHSKMSQSEFNSIVDAPNYEGYGSPGLLGVSGFEVHSKMASSDMSRASLTYDKNAPKGLTVEMNMGYSQPNGSYAFIYNKTMGFDKGETSGYEDANYPVDVRTFNSPEYKDYYKDNDFIGGYGNVSSSIWVASASSGSIYGYLKGSGYVSYGVDGIGVDITSAMSGKQGLAAGAGSIWGSATDKNKFLEPSILAGWGAQLSGGYSFGVGVEGGIWASFNAKQDAITFDRKKATFVGGFIGMTSGFSARFKKIPVPQSGGTAPTPAVSYSTQNTPSN